MTKILIILTSWEHLIMYPRSVDLLKLDILHFERLKTHYLDNYQPRLFTISVIKQHINPLLKIN